MRDAQKSSHRVLLFLVVSAYFHWMLRSLHIPEPSVVVGDKSSDQEVIIENYDESETRQVVKTLKSLDSKESRESARFLGEFRNRVKKELQSPFKGRFQTGGPPPESEPGSLGMGDLLPFGRTPNSLPQDIPEGNETVLNTEPVIYASFINRISDAIYDPWVSYAREAMTSMALGGKQLGANTYITRLQVVMDSDGSVMAMQTLSSSGIAELDDAPKRAFWETEPFRNPPKQMFKSESIVRFSYEFSFEIRNSVFSIVPDSI